MLTDGSTNDNIIFPVTNHVSNCNKMPNSPPDNDDTNFGRPLFEILYVNGHGKTEFGYYEFNLYSKNYFKLLGTDCLTINNAKRF